MNLVKAEETMTLSDDQLKGQKYFPLNIADKQLTFVGLEVPSMTALASVPDATVSLPPQALMPLSSQSRIPKKINGTPVIWESLCATD